jgi:hypothetical protein
MKDKVIKKFRDVGVIKGDKTKLIIINNDTLDKVEMVGLVSNMLTDQEIKFDKDRLDLLNFAKSELEHLVRHKLDKYHINLDSVRFLTKMINKLSNGKEGFITISETDGYNDKLIATNRPNSGMTFNRFKYPPTDWAKHVPQYGDKIQITDVRLPYGSDTFVIIGVIPDSRLYQFVTVDTFESGTAMIAKGYVGERQFEIIK